ncbi:MAG TPA: TIGR03560 family F420-dependent LLM class oxidoreductase [Candidatus Acidoferrales bacterium]|nr:TIGR03560 family F420-dependent LLM class oxidoreductase [Candidatus Acidoferrales bacterium]
MGAFHFGVTLPQIKRSWQETQATALELDRLGFHSVWFNDHLYGIPMPQLPILEAWTALAAVGAITQRVELGTLVTPVGFRNPALLAKMAATLDFITSGRVIVGLGSGWFESEFKGYGLPFPKLKQRLEQLDEAATIMKLLWTDEQSSFEGRHFRVDSVYCEPKPVRRPPILVGGGGEKVLLRIAAQHADIWNNLAVNQGDLAAKIQKLHEHCEAIQRDPSEIRISQQCLVVIGDTEADAQAKVQKAAAIYGGHMGAAGPLSIFGTPQQCIEKIGAHVDLGCSMLVMEFFGRDTRHPARLFAEEVMPAFA